MHQRTANVACRLEQETTRQTGAVGPCSLPDGEVDGGKQQDAEGDGKEEGGAEVWGVTQDGGFDGAQVADLCAFPVGFAVG